MHADDASLLISSSAIPELTRSASSKLIRIQQWFTNNGLSVNKEKNNVSKIILLNRVQ
nr:unnamed protein product [Callosobruchus analis]